MVCLVAVLAACSSVDCPLNNVVYAKYKLMGNVTRLEDVLTVSTHRADGSDTILLNMQQRADSFNLPMSYGLATDEIYLTRTADSYTLRDTIWIDKTNEPHFESVDCGVNYFHTITAVRATTNNIDSVKINNRNVSYNADKAHIYIYYRQ